MDDRPPLAPLLAQFAQLHDPRVDRTKRHQLIDVVAIALCAIICGADTWVEVELFGKAKQAWLGQWLALPHGIPSHDTFGSRLRAVGRPTIPGLFLGLGARRQHADRGTVGGDRRQDRPAFARPVHRQGRHPPGGVPGRQLTAWCSDRPKWRRNSNEITAIPALLRVLEVSGCLVTIDAIGCQKEIAATIHRPWRGLCPGAQGKSPPTPWGRPGDVCPGPGAPTLPNSRTTSTKRSTRAMGAWRSGAVGRFSDPAHLRYVNDRQEWCQLRSLVLVESERFVAGHSSVDTRYSHLQSAQPRGALAGRHQSPLGH